jgi:hypothetical protein
MGVLVSFVSRSWIDNLVRRLVGGCADESSSGVASDAGLFLVPFLRLLVCCTIQQVSVKTRRACG